LRPPIPRDRDAARADPTPLGPPPAPLASRLQRADFAGSTTAAARRLLGCWLCHRVGDDVVRGRIVEVEAYTDDAASHAARGKRTPRNAVMFGPPGVVYVYFTYGMHHCFNVVTETAGVPGAVLIRGLDGIVGAAGPARLCRALGFSTRDTGRDLVTDPHLWIERHRRRRGERMIRARRIGIRVATDLPWRYYLWGSAGVSKRDRHAEGETPGATAARRRGRRPLDAAEPTDHHRR
jgi:DNA-3-methyladenine glycosylase